MNTNPETLSCTEGKVIVEITEKLGGLKNKVYRPPEDHAGKDTATGMVIKIGPAPKLYHSGLEHTIKNGKNPWPSNYPSLKSGDVVVFPRDVPMAFTWEDKRYAIIFLHEIIFKANKTEFEVYTRPQS